MKVMLLFSIFTEYIGVSVKVSMKGTEHDTIPHDAVYLE